MPKFLVSLADGTTATHELAEPRSPSDVLADNALQIEDASVSSHHAELTLGEGGDYLLTDIGSTNGTQLNGKEITEGEPQRLQAGDKVRFGNIEASLRLGKSGRSAGDAGGGGNGAVTASSSVRPKDFANASPFQTKKKKKDRSARRSLAFRRWRWSRSWRRWRWSSR